MLSEAVRILHPDGMLAALLLNTQSAHVRSNLKREGSYFQQLVHGETEELASTVAEFVATKQEYFLGIHDQMVVGTADPEKAANLAVTGKPRHDRPMTIQSVDE